MNKQQITSISMMRSAFFASLMVTPCHGANMPSPPPPSNSSSVDIHTTDSSPISRKGDSISPSTDQTYVMILLVPPAMEYRTQITDANIFKVSCHYTSRDPTIIRSIFDTVHNGILPGQPPSRIDVDMRVGVLFYKNNKLSGSAYMQSAGKADFVVGIIDNVPHRLEARLPTYISGIATSISLETPQVDNTSCA